MGETAVIPTGHTSGCVKEQPSAKGLEVRIRTEYPTILEIEIERRRDHRDGEAGVVSR
jgi:hypothetical protein